MTAPLLEVEDLGKRFGGFVALEGISLEVAQGERLGLIGPNGSGKSTLVNCLCGTLRNESGSVKFDGTDLEGRSAHERTRWSSVPIFRTSTPTLWPHPWQARAECPAWATCRCPLSRRNRS